MVLFPLGVFSSPFIGSRFYFYVKNSAMEVGSFFL